MHQRTREILDQAIEPLYPQMEALEESIGDSERAEVRATIITYFAALAGATIRATLADASDDKRGEIAGQMFGCALESMAKAAGFQGGRCDEEEIAEALKLKIERPEPGRN